MKNFKKIFIFVLASVFGLNVSAQSESGNIEFTLDANAYNTKTSDGFGYEFSLSKRKGVNLSFTSDFDVSPGTYFGLSVRYLHENENRIHKFWVDSFYQATESNLKTASVIPYLRLGKRINLTEKLQLKTTFSVGYGFSKLNGSSEYVGIETGKPDYTLGGGIHLTQYISDEVEEKFNFINLSVQPTLSYYFNSCFGLSLGLGGIEYMKVADSDDSQWLFSVSPQYWMLGLNYKL